MKAKDGNLTVGVTNGNTGLNEKQLFKNNISTKYIYHLLNVIQTHIEPQKKFQNVLG